MDDGTEALVSSYLRHLQRLGVTASRCGRPGDRGRLGSRRTLRALKSRQRSGGPFQGWLLSGRAWSDVKGVS